MNLPKSIPINVSSRYSSTDTNKSKPLVFAKSPKVAVKKLLFEKPKKSIFSHKSSDQEYDNEPSKSIEEIPKTEQQSFLGNIDKILE